MGSMEAFQPIYWNKSCPGRTCCKHGNGFTPWDKKLSHTDRAPRIEHIPRGEGQWRGRWEGWHDHRPVPRVCPATRERIRSDLKRGTYHPAAVRRVMIPKPNGDLRPLGIPTVLDRVIQQAIAQVLTPVFDPHFSTHSYGFRYGKQAHQAVRAVEAANAAGYTQAVDCDLKSFFDTVNHDRLLNLLSKRITDKRVLQLIGRYLRAGVRLPEGTRAATTQGVPQGGPLSPLLANVMLDPLDKELEKRGHRFARYADDFLILKKSARAAGRVMQSVTRYVEGRLGLVVNRQKSQVAPLSRCTFLGFAIKRGKVVWTDKAYLLRAAVPS